MRQDKAVSRSTGARPRGRALDPAVARRRSAAREVADRHRVGRRDRAARRRRVARRPDRPDGPVRHQRPPGAHERVPPGPRRLARRDAAWPREPLPPHAGRVAPLRRGVPAHLCAARPRIGTARGNWCWPMRSRRPRGARCATSSRGRDSVRWRRRRSCARTWARGRCRPSSARRQRGAAGRRRRSRATCRGSAPLAVAAAQAWPLAALAADYRRFLQHFGGVIERFRAGARARPGAVLHRAHAAHPCVPPRDAARPAAAAGAAAARLAGRCRLRAVPRLLPAHASLRRTAPARDAARQRRAPAAGERGVLRALRGPRTPIRLPRPPRPLVAGARARHNAQAMAALQFPSLALPVRPGVPFLLMFVGVVHRARLGQPRRPARARSASRRGIRRPASRCSCCCATGCGMRRGSSSPLSWRRS